VHNNKKNPLIGMGLMMLAMVLVPILDLFAKLLSADYAVIEITWARFVFHGLWLLPLLTWKGIVWWKLPQQPVYQLMRSLMLTATTVSFFFAIKDNPIPTALTLLFISPLIVAVVAPLWLGETFDTLRGVAVVCGFLGVVVVLRPNADDFSPSILWALVAGVGYAFYIMFTRKLSSSSPPLLTLFYTAVGGVLVLTPFVGPVWITPDVKGLVMMASMGLFAALGHFFIIMACEYATASQLSPFNYFEIVAATVISYFVFDFFPDIYVWVGIAIICSSGAYVSWRELQLSKRARAVADGRIEIL
jgi:drug/metabolite transporter (DMT)-like permease|tara:strand:- start:496 stop:1404 length:909 start_codon:yes stop_codon:yes gene_type:complete